MHSKKIGKVLNVGLIHCFFVRFIASLPRSRKFHWLYHKVGPVHLISLFFDETDIAAPFHARHPYIRSGLQMSAEPQVFFEVVSGDVVSPHR